MALLSCCIYKLDDSRFLIDNSPPIAPSNLSSQNLTPRRVKFRFLFARVPQCRSVWAQPSLLLQSISKTRRAFTLIDLGAADSPWEVACPILSMRTRLVKERERENHGNCMNVYWRRYLVLLRNRFLVRCLNAFLLRCLIISEARRYPPPLGWH